MEITIQKVEALDGKPLVLIWFGDKQIVLDHEEFKDLKDKVNSFETALEVPVQE